MVAEITMYEAQKKKLQGLCDEHELTFRFIKDKYPIMLIIRPTQGLDAQLSLLENVEEKGYISPEASMMWIFEDGGLKVKVSGGTFTISKTLRTKIESVLMKMITFWQQYFFRDVLERNALKAGAMPEIDEADALPEAEPLDEYDDEDRGDGDGAEEVDENEPAVDEADPLISEAISVVRLENKATISLIQRRLNVGYSKASRIMDTLEDMGVVGPFMGSAPREVLPVDAPVEEGAAKDADEQG